MELRVEAPGRGQVRTMVSALRPRGLNDLGDLYVTDLASLRVGVAFPAVVPDREFRCSVARPSMTGDGKKTELAARSFTPKSLQAIDFAELEPGLVAVDCGDGRDIHNQRIATIAAGEQAELEFSFVPVRVAGTVRRGERPVPGATVMAPVSGPSEARIETTSDDFGAYEIVTWPGRDSIMLLTTPPEDRLPLAEQLTVETGTTELDHDVLLPSRSVRGTVRDAATGAIVSGAQVEFTGSLAMKDAEWGNFSMGATTDEEGRFQLGNLQDRPLEVEVTHEGYARTRLRDVRPTPEGTELDVRLEKGLRLAGIVLDDSGSPVPNISVGLDLDFQGIYMQRTVTTSPSGEFDFGEVAQGPHLLGVFRCGSVFVLKPVEVGSAESAPARQIVQLLPASTSIELRVEDTSGAPVSGAAFRWTVNGITVPLEDWGRAAGACGQPYLTDENGRLVLQGFPSGVIGAATLDRRPLGTFANDGTLSTWTLRMPAKEKRSKSEDQVAAAR